jgi:hypothetical protein
MSSTTRPQPTCRHGGREARRESCAAASAALIATLDQADSRIGGPGYPATPNFFKDDIQRVIRDACNLDVPYTYVLWYKKIYHTDILQY